MNGYHLATAVRTLHRTGVIAYPCEACFGLGCDPHAYTAVARIRLLKRRSVQQGMIMIAANLAQIRPYVALTYTQLKAYHDRYWPGPVTLLMPASANVPDWIRGNSNKVALRIPSMKLLHALCVMAQRPLVSTSANVHAQPPIRQTKQLNCVFGKRVDYVLPGRIHGRSRPSTIIDIENERMIRP